MTTNERLIMKKTFYFVATALLALVACTKETPVPEKTEQPVDAVEQELTTIYAFLDDIKSEVNTTTGAFTWVTDELISVAPTSGTEYNNTFKCTTPAEGAFTGTGDAGAIAISPKQDAGTYTSETDFQVSLPSSYSYVEGVTNALMVGTKVSETKYQFKHAAALLVVTYNNVPANTSALKVTSTTASQKLTGTVPLNGTDVSDIEIANDNTGLSGNEVNITFAKTDANVPSMTFYVPIPTGTYDAITFELVNDDSDLQASTLKTLKGATLNRADVYVIPAVQLVDGFAPYLVGKDDYAETGWGYDHSEKYLIENGKVLNIEFVNYGNTGEAYWNWVLVLANKGYTKNGSTGLRTDPEDGFSEYYMIRSDRHGWNEHGGTYFDIHRMSMTYNGSREVDFGAPFKNTMNGATVKMKIERTSKGWVNIEATATNNEITIVLKTTQKLPESGDVYAMLKTDHSKYQINKVWQSNRNKNELSLSENRLIPYYYYETALPMSLIASNVSVNYGAGDVAVEPTKVVFNSTLSADGVSQEIEAICGNASSTLSIDKAKGIGEVGSISTDNSWWFLQQYTEYVDLPSSQDVTLYMYVYSNCCANWTSPQINLKDSSNEVTTRLDNWVNSSNDSVYLNIDSNKSNNWGAWMWVNYMKNQQNNRVTVKVSNNGNGTVTTRYSTKNLDGETHYQNYYNINLASDALKYRIEANGCYIVFVNEATATSGEWPLIQD